MRSKAQQYLSVRTHGAKIKDWLGQGTDGAVWVTTDDTAVKIFERAGGYFNERDTYQRLAEFGVTDQLEGFWVPQIRGWDDQIMASEMDLMQRPPFIIDFAKVKIDRPPDFSSETQREIEAQCQELFEDDWPAVQRLLAALESFQIYYLDPKPHNIVLPKK